MVGWDHGPREPRRWVLKLYNLLHRLGILK